MWLYLMNLWHSKILFILVITPSLLKFAVYPVIYVSIKRQIKSGDSKNYQLMLWMECGYELVWNV